MNSVALAENARCPAHELGAFYPWESREIRSRDQFAWIYLDVDRKGYVVRCAFGKNNFPDPEGLFWLCKSYSDRWRATPAANSDPAIRTLERFALIASYEHTAADRKARKLWFQQHPEERPECYPEPTRADRLG
jgi:hypothetical protein